MIVTLTHHERGPMRVAVWDEATWWMGKRQWTCAGDPELGSFEDDDFQETPEQIEAALQAEGQARGDHARDEFNFERNYTNPE